MRNATPKTSIIHYLRNVSVNNLIMTSPPSFLASYSVTLLLCPPFGNVAKFITNENGARSETKSRLNLGNACYIYRIFLYFCLICKNTENKLNIIYTAIILPIVLCGCKNCPVISRPGMSVNRIISPRVGN